MRGGPTFDIYLALYCTNDMSGVNSVLFNKNSLGTGYADALEPLQQNRNLYSSSALSASLYFETLE